jgi:predicted HTH transcriptional regulator
VPETNEVIDCVFRLERRKLLVFTIAPSERLHHMTDDATYLRVGDEKRKLSDRNRRAAVRQVREHLGCFFGRRGRCRP